MPYLDHAATTPLRPEVAEAMARAHRDAWGNPSSLHAEGRRARVALETARERVADVLGAEPGEVVFTSGGTEADNLALWGVLAALPDRPGLVTSAVEHEAVLHTARALERDGHPVTVLDPDSTGRVSTEAVAEALDDATGLVSVILANNEIGTLNPVRDIALTAREAGAFIHTDAVQAPGMLPVGLDALGVDLFSISAHKLGGPKGVGALVVRARTPFVVRQTGGSQERKRRGGTENVPGIVGLGEALALAEAERAETAIRVAGLRDALRRSLEETMGDRLVVHTPSNNAAPHILSVSLRPDPPVDGEMLLAALDLEGVRASAGSACTSGALEPSHVLLALGVPRETAAATVRFSFGRSTTEADVAQAHAAFVRVVGRLDAVAA